jgi:lysophospholipase L1-like esterase
MSSAALIASSATIQAGINAATGKTVTIHPNCTGSTALIDVPQLLAAIRANNPAAPPIIACDKATPGLPFPVGDLFVLDAAEQATLSATIAGYNAYIASKAASIGFAYYDPNPLFAAKRASGEIPPFPVLTSATATFGNLISLDGVHPSLAAHTIIANELIAVINAKYGTALKSVP